MLTLCIPINIDPRESTVTKIKMTIQCMIIDACYLIPMIVSYNS